MIRFPAEWEKQSAVLIAWPHQSGDFVTVLESVEKTYVTIAKTITQYQQLIIVCHDDNHQQRIKNLLGDEANMHFIQAAINDTWVRDTVFLSIENDNNPVLKNFRFNGWGDKYIHHEDDALNHKLLPHLPFRGTTHQDIDFVLEGGSLESDGLGTLLTTRQCLLNPNRNPNFSQQEIEQVLIDHLGISRFLWLDQESLDGDDTDAHIDTLARFCSETTIAYTSCEDTEDHHYAGLKNMESQLSTLRTQDNNPYNLVALPLPNPIYNDDGDRLPANYANFLIINDAVLVPAYDDPMDEIALNRIAECFPDRKTIAIPSRPLVYQYGSLHCMTMQFPEKALFR
ncbi:MAG: agmatine deiminase family protein [Methylococcaceae bacterium]|nr:agmatine deiminase family protein [Methylococcaceae bacterium]